MTIWHKEEVQVEEGSVAANWSADCHTAMNEQVILRLESNSWWCQCVLWPVISSEDGLLERISPWGLFLLDTTNAKRTVSPASLCRGLEAQIAAKPISTLLEGFLLRQLQEVLSWLSRRAEEFTTVLFFSSALSFWCIVLGLPFNLHLGREGWANTQS